MGPTEEQSPAKEQPAQEVSPMIAGTIMVKVPPGVSAGQIVNFELPGGDRREAIVPEGKVPGDEFQVIVAAPGHPAVNVTPPGHMSHVTVKVPEGAEPGQVVRFPGPDGRPMEALVPEGKSAGQEFQVTMGQGPQRSVTVIVPEGTQAGQMVHFFGPDGQPMKAVVPDGKSAGDRFEVVLGPNQVTLVVPHDVTEGQEIEFRAPTGVVMRATVPAGLKGGDEFSVSLLSKDYVEMSELCAAASAGDLEVVKKRISEGLPVNAVFDMGFTPIFYAATHGKTEVCQWLLDQKADVTVQNNDKRTPLHWAARNGHADVVKMLLSAKAKLDCPDSSNRDPLALATDKGQTAIVEILKAAKAAA